MKPNTMDGFIAFSFEDEDFDMQDETWHNTKPRNPLARILGLSDICLRKATATHFARAIREQRKPPG